MGRRARCCTDRAGSGGLGTDVRGVGALRTAGEHCLAAMGVAAGGRAPAVPRNTAGLPFSPPGDHGRSSGVSTWRACSRIKAAWVVVVVRWRSSLGSSCPAGRCRAVGHRRVLSRCRGPRRRPMWPCCRRGARWNVAAAKWHSIRLRPCCATSRVIPMHGACVRTFSANGGGAACCGWKRSRRSRPATMRWGSTCTADSPMARRQNCAVSRAPRRCSRTRCGPGLALPTRCARTIPNVRWRSTPISTPPPMRTRWWRLPTRPCCATRKIGIRRAKSIRAL